MKLENSALDEKGFIEKSLSIETVDNGTFKITAKGIPVGKKEEQTIDMIFTKNGMAAVLGSWMVIADKSAKEAENERD